MTLDKYDKAKQIRALMPNLIHSLDATSLSLLYNIFLRKYPEAQFFSIHDCFATTFDKVTFLKEILASVYTDLYSNTQYLKEFDGNIIEYIHSNTDYKIDENRTIELDNGKFYILHDIKWVLNEINVDKRKVKKIDSQHI